MAHLAAGVVRLGESAPRLLTPSAKLVNVFVHSCGLLPIEKQIRTLTVKAGTSVAADQPTASQQNASDPHSPAGDKSNIVGVEGVLADTSSSGVDAVLSSATAVVPVPAERPTQSYVSAEVLANISSTVNQLTGYESIDRIKSSVVEADRHLQRCKQQLQAAKVEYEQQLAKQTQLHREVTALLQRKSSWVPADVARFTELYAAEHETEQAVAAAKARYTGLGDEAERLQLQLVDLIRERYQQEQLWSDKIRRASTWWTWGLMGLHFASFVLVYSVFEPRKRAALQEAIAGMLEQHTAAVDARIMTLTPATAAAAAAVDGEAAGGDERQQQQRQRQEATVKQHQQQHGHATVEHMQSFQQQLLHELRSLREQLNDLQEVAPQAAAAAAQAAVVEEQQPRSRVPGSRWLVQQWTTASQSIHGLWQSSRHTAQQLYTRGRSGQQTVVEAQQPPQAVQADASSSSSKTSSDSVTADQSAAEQHVAQHQPPHQQEQMKQQQPLNSDASNVTSKVRAPAVGRSHEQTTAPPPPAAAATSAASTAKAQPAAEAPASLLQQWTSGDAVLKVTRSQLAVITAGAGAVGAGVAAGLLLLLRSSRGAGSS